MTEAGIRTRCMRSRRHLARMPLASCAILFNKGINGSGGNLFNCLTRCRGRSDGGRRMIGTKSFLLELLWLLFPLGFLAVGIGICVKKRRLSNFTLIVFASIMSTMTGIRYFQQASNHQFLANLNASAIRSITVGDTIITDPVKIVTLTNSLNDCQWFSSNHGGWADTVDLIITLKDGDVCRYLIGYYLPEHGVVIEFYRGHTTGHWSDGYAFSATLPESLAEAGVKLPKQP